MSLVSITMTTTTCPTCGISFAVPEHYLREKKAEAGSIRCPNGHSATWAETEASKLRKRLEREEAAVASARREREELRRSEQAQRAAATRARRERDKDRKRVAHGVCPCCKRTFKQLDAHMKNKHPEYVAEANVPQA